MQLYVRPYLQLHHWHSLSRWWALTTTEILSSRIFAINVCNNVDVTCHKGKRLELIIFYGSWRCNFDYPNWTRANHQVIMLILWVGIGWINNEQVLRKDKSVDSFITGVFRQQLRKMRWSVHLDQPEWECTHKTEIYPALSSQKLTWSKLWLGLNAG